MDSLPELGEISDSDSEDIDWDSDTEEDDDIVSTTKLPVFAETLPKGYDMAATAARSKAESCHPKWYAGNSIWKKQSQLKAEKTSQPSNITDLVLEHHKLQRWRRISSTL
jgi:hypothetical protein